MKSYLKAGILTLVLVVPAFLVLFLHSFGENHFQLPYLVPLTDSSGKVSMNGKDTLFYRLPNKNQNTIEIVGFMGSDEPLSKKEALAMLEKMASNEVVITKIASDSAEVIARKIYRVQPIKKAKPNKTISYDEQFLLIDKQGFIRGNYDATSPEEVDRLSAEVKILLDIYEKEKN
ncbi:MAG: hypothetical protein R2822_06395 [Spirosomataceae bacterium]